MEKPKVLALVVYLPVNIAAEIYRESGDLAISKFPNILKFAESIAETIDLEQIENFEKDDVESVFIPKNERKTYIKSSRKR